MFSNKLIKVNGEYIDINDYRFDLQLFARATDILKKIEPEIRNAVFGDREKGIDGKVMGIEENELVKAIGIHEPLPEREFTVLRKDHTGKDELTKITTFQLTGEDITYIEELNSFDEEKIKNSTGLLPDHMRFYSHLFDIIIGIQKTALRYTDGKKSYLLPMRKDVLERARAYYAPTAKESLNSNTAFRAINKALDDLSGVSKEVVDKSLDKELELKNDVSKKNSSEPKEDFGVVESKDQIKPAPKRARKAQLTHEDKFYALKSTASPLKYVNETDIKDLIKKFSTSDIDFLKKQLKMINDDRRKEELDRAAKKKKSEQDKIDKYEKDKNNLIGTRYMDRNGKMVVIDEVQAESLLGDINMSYDPASTYVEVLDRLLVESEYGSQVSRQFADLDAIFEKIEKNRKERLAFVNAARRAAQEANAKALRRESVSGRASETVASPPEKSMKLKLIEKWQREREERGEPFFVTGVYPSGKAIMTRKKPKLSSSQPSSNQSNQ